MVDENSYNEREAGDYYKEWGMSGPPFMTPMQQYGSSILLLTNPENDLYKMELTFRGMKLNNDGNPEEAGEPYMNAEGVTSVIGQVQAIVSQVTIMSNLSKDNEIPNIMDFLGDTLAKDLMVNRFKYGIKDFATRDKIYFIALTQAFITMKRACEQSLSDKKFWRGSVQEVKNVIDNQKSRGALSVLNPFRQD